MAYRPGHLRHLRVFDHLSRLAIITWEPVSLAELQEMIQRDLAERSEQERSFFAQVAIEPEKHQSRSGDEGGGFWAVAVHQDRALWFNDIEDGCNVSTFKVRGEIPEDEYWCNDDRLQWALPNLMGKPSRWTLEPSSGIS